MAEAPAESRSLGPGAGRRSAPQMTDSLKVPASRQVGPRRRTQRLSGAGRATKSRAGPGACESLPARIHPWFEDRARKGRRPRDRSVVGGSWKPEDGPLSSASVSLRRSLLGAEILDVAVRPTMLPSDPIEARKHVARRRGIGQTEGARGCGPAPTVGVQMWDRATPALAERGFLDDLGERRVAGGGGATYAPGGKRSSPRRRELESRRAQHRRSGRRRGRPEDVARRGCGSVSGVHEQLDAAPPSVCPKRLRAGRWRRKGNEPFL
jgi:hypothetical protein